MLTELRKSLKNEKKDQTIFDIVIFGSAVKGKSRPNDIDIMVIFREGKLKERLNQIQKIKKKIKIKVDLKGILWEELFQKEFFGRTGIFLEGISLFDGQSFSKKIGFLPSVIFLYNLKDKTHNEKVKFNYLLSGRGTQGMVKRLGGKHLSPGVIEIPIKNSSEFEEILKDNGIKYSKREVLTTT